MLLLEQLVTLIDEGYTSGSQLVAMQNYMLQRGHTEQADLFYGVLRDRETGGEFSQNRYCLPSWLLMKRRRMW